MKQPCIWLLIAVLLMQVENGQSLSYSGDIQTAYESAMHVENWTLSNEFGFPMSIAFSLAPVAGRANLHKLYLYIADQDFTKANIQKAFTGLALKHHGPAMIITAFSDQSMLLRAISTSEGGVAIEFSPALEKQEAIQRFLVQFYPLKSGYYRAYFFRSIRGNESFLYSPDPNNEELVRIQLSDLK